MCFSPLFLSLVALDSLGRFSGAFFENHVAFIRSSKGVKDCGERFTDIFFFGPAWPFVCWVSVKSTISIMTLLLCVFFFWVKVTNELLRVK